MLLTTKSLVIRSVIVGLVLVLGGYAAGRYTAPDRVVYKERTVETEASKTVATLNTIQILEAVKQLQKEVESFQKVQASIAKDVHTRKVVERRADGSSTTTTEVVDTSKSAKVTETGEKSKTTDTETTIKKDQTQKTEQTERVVYKEREVTKIVERERPAWGLALTPGYDFAGALGHGQPVNLIPSSVLPLRHVVLGASIERRVLGPLSAGLWGNSQGSGGLIFRLEF